MISNKLPPDTLSNAKVNMFWDGIFHLGTWSLTVIGLSMLWRLIQRTDVQLSTGLFLGGLILGWGVFNTMDSVFDHYLFGLHNVRENVANPQIWNHGFLVLALLQLAIGWMIISRSRKRQSDV